MQLQNELQRHHLGLSAGVLPLADQAALRSASAHMAGQATRELAIFSRDLDAPLYDSQDFLEPLRQLALQGGPRVRVRVLLFDPEPAVQSGHRLVELARQHTSHIQMRGVPPEFSRHTEAYLLADDSGYVLRRQADVLEGSADYNAPATVRRLREQFDHIWERGELLPDLRRLHL